MKRKKQLLYRRNCSKRNIGTNERSEYFAVVMRLFLYFAGWWGAFMKTTLSSLLSCRCEDRWSSPWDPPFSALMGPTAIKYMLLLFQYFLSLKLLPKSYYFIIKNSEGISYLITLVITCLTQPVIYIYAFLTCWLTILSVQIKTKPRSEFVEPSYHFSTRCFHVAGC